MKYKIGIFSLAILLVAYFVFFTLPGRKEKKEVAQKKTRPQKHPRENTFNEEGIVTNKKLIKNGDLVLRNGEDFISATAREFSKVDKSYSHCGIAVTEGDSIYIYHSIGDPSGGGVRKDRFEDFCNYKENVSFGIYRYNFSKKVIDKLVSVAKLKYAEKLKFDSDFDFTTDDAQYCSEFIYKAVLVASDSTILLPKNAEVVALDNLYLNKYATKIASFQYKIIKGAQ